MREMASRALEKIRRFAAALEAAKDSRDDAIREADKEGFSLRQISAVAGVTHETVRSIIKGPSAAP
jgi:DNA-directed RNA polymerase specialized sigma24 family protein